MRKHLLLSVLLLISINVLAENNFPQISEYWVRTAPPNAMMQAAYGTLTNNSEKDIVLVNAYSPAFNMTEVHKSYIENGVAKMAHQPELIIKAGEKLVFKPGSYHIMLMHPIIKFTTGDEIKINLIYQQGDERKVQEIWFPVEDK